MMITQKNYLLIFWRWLLFQLPFSWKYRLHLCMEKGCGHPGFGCYLPDDDQIPSYYFCGDHSQSNGFCWGCGQFWGGIESFDFGHGLCDNCKEDDWEEEEDPEFDYMMNYPYD